MSMPDMNDFTGFLKKALPWIGAAATGNVPALIAMAAKTVGDTLGVEVSAEPAAISDAVANATPEQIIALKTAEQTFQRRCRMGFAQSRNGADWPRCDTSVHRRHCGAPRSMRRPWRLLLGIAGLSPSQSAGTSSRVPTSSAGRHHHQEVGIVARCSDSSARTGYAAQSTQVAAYIFGSVGTTTRRRRWPQRFCTSARCHQTNSLISLYA